MSTKPGSSLLEKYHAFMATRNGPDALSRDSLVLAVVLIVIALFLSGAARTIVLFLGFVALVYCYFRLFSSNTDQRRRENDAYAVSRARLVGKVTAPFKKAGDTGAKAARRAGQQAKDREHRYFACPKCGQEVRVPVGVGKIRVTCPKCGEKFDRKA
ncbi:zinc ribbon domain-containing protein [bacterium]|nr:zinc ribbon domain-containing protein [bacterium]